MKMLQDFHAFKLAKRYYQVCKQLKLPFYLKGQLLRASSSIALTLAEGSGKRTPRDQIRYYSMSLGSLRECQGILDLEEIEHTELKNLGNQLGPILFKLSRISRNSNCTPDPKLQTPNNPTPDLSD